MTTVVTDGKIMVADAQMTDGSVKAKFHGKIRKINGDLVGGAGDVESVLRFMKWYENPATKPPKVGKNFEALVVGKDGIWAYGPSFIPIKLEESFYAIGSGYTLALGAMEAGASALKAVEIACKRDVGSGIEIVQIELDKPRAKRGQRAKLPARNRVHSRSRVRKGQQRKS